MPNAITNFIGPERASHLQTPLFTLVWTSFALRGYAVGCAAFGRVTSGMFIHVVH